MYCFQQIKLAQAFNCQHLLHTFAVMKVKNHYRTLGIHYKATGAEIRNAYRKLAMKYHPDVNGSKTAQTILAEINEAYNVLSNPERRKQYDLYELEEFTEVKVYEKNIRDIYQKITELRRDVVKMDRYRMDTNVIFKELMHQLSDRNMEIINNNDEALLRKNLFEEVIGIIYFLDYSQQVPVMEQLKKINTPNSLDKFAKQQKATYLLNKYKLAIAIIAALFLLMILSALF